MSVYNKDKNMAHIKEPYTSIYKCTYMLSIYAFNKSGNRAGLRLCGRIALQGAQRGVRIRETAADRLSPSRRGSGFLVSLFTYLVTHLPAHLLMYIFILLSFTH